MPTALPRHVREAWRVVGTRTERRRLGPVSTIAETTLYEHVSTADALDALGDGSIPVRSLFVTDLSIRPSFTTLGVAPGTVLEMVAPRAKRQFVESVGSDGLLVDGEREATRFERADGTAGRRYVFDAAFSADPTLTADRSGTITAETHVGVWPTDTDYGMAGGTFPLESPSGFEAALAVDPERDRATVLEVVRTVEVDCGRS